MRLKFDIYNKHDLQKCSDFLIYSVPIDCQHQIMSSLLDVVSVLPGSLGLLNSTTSTLIDSFVSDVFGGVANSLAVAGHSLGTVLDLFHINNSVTDSPEYIPLLGLGVHFTILDRGGRAVRGGHLGTGGRSNRGMVVGGHIPTGLGLSLVDGPRVAFGKRLRILWLPGFDQLATLVHHSGGVLLGDRGDGTHFGNGLLAVLCHNGVLMDILHLLTHLPRVLHLPRGTFPHRGE